MKKQANKQTSRQASRQAKIREQKAEAVARVIGIVLFLYLFLCYHDVVAKQGTPSRHGEPLANWNVLQAIFEE